MKINNELTHVTNEPRLEDGTLAEPEQQTVTHALATESGVSGHMTPDEQEGAIPTSVLIQNPVSMLLGPLRNPCRFCAHFDNEAFVTMFAAADHPAAPIHLREMMNSIRVGLLQTRNAEVASMSAGQDGELDVEHAIRSLGFCRALGEAMNDYVVVHPAGSCPAEVITPTEPNGLFKPRDNASERAGAAAYDKLIDAARGNR